jgi:5' nucleotidase, deoxy (Pyrimidine), cytosolic type C protein (NT5C)
MKLGIDIDGCLANFNKAYGNLLIQVTGVNLLPSEWDSHPDFPGVWDWDSAVGYSTQDIQAAWTKIVTSPRFWESLEPLDNAKDTVKALNRLGKKGAEIYFLTHRMGLRSKVQTERWLYNLGMDYPTVILTGNKAPIAQNLGLTFFVDDKVENVNAVAIAWPKAQTFVVDRLYNRENREAGVKPATSVPDALKQAGILEG